ncbi:MAG: ABC transporter substrate-binding protein, partial [Gammaproteobacteria bacterium]|nr:ABC transporter substrate-binding protein [Gammaproteobacteria bacterium]
MIGAAIGLRLPGSAANSASNSKAASPTTDANHLPATATNSNNIYKWKMVTSWPANAPGTGAVAARLAQRITALSDQRIQIKLYAAGELVGGLEVLDAVARGTAELGHSASFFWQGKTPLAAFFTAVPFGLNPDQHHSWLYQGGGQELWDELYKPLGLKPFAAGNTG